MPASLAVRAHWSVSTAAALKKDTSVTPGVHSLPENVLKLQQMNIPQRRFFNSSARLAISTGWVAPSERAIANRASRVFAVLVITSPLMPEPVVQEGVRMILGPPRRRQPRPEGSIDERWRVRVVR